MHRNKREKRNNAGNNKGINNKEITETGKRERDNKRR